MRSFARSAAPLLSVLGVCASALSSTPAFAQADADRATARALGQDGEQALEHQDFKTAEDRFRRADSLVHAPTLMLGLARALAGEGRYVEAQEAYNRIVREGLPANASEPFKRALADAKKEVDGVSAKIAGVTISVHASGGADVPNPKVVLDGATVSVASLGVRRAVDPGSHVLQVSADGFKPAELRFDLPEAGSANEVVTLEAEPGAVAAATTPAGATNEATVLPSGTSGHKGSVLPWVAFGVGGAGLVLGAITGGLAMSKHSDLANSGHCPDQTCDPTVADSVNSYHTFATVSTVGFIVGGIGVAAGVVLLLTQPKSSETAKAGVHVLPVIGPGSLGAIGTF